MRPRTLGWIGAGLLAATLLVGTLGVALAQTAPPGGFGPGGMMGTGPWGGSGPGWGPGGMHGGRGPGGMMAGSGPGGRMGGPWQGAAGAAAAPLTSLADAQAAFQAYLDRLGNPDLALDEVMEFQWNFYAIVEEKSSGNGAFELLADKQSGAVFPEFGPNMMWNTKYGHMGAMMGGYAQPGGEPSVTREQARQIAQQWLDANAPGSATEEPDAFPGYYTLHITRDGQINGMLSVNAYSGQVWYHTWHGSFVASLEGAG